MVKFRQLIFINVLALVFSFFIIGFDNVLAQSDLSPNLQFNIGDLDSNDFQPNEPGNWIGQYIAAIYRYGVGVAAFLAVIMIMIGGLIWLTSAGKSGQVETGKDFVKSALFGLLLAMFSFVMLYAINPRLTVFQPLSISSPDLKSPAYGSSQNFCCNSLTGERTELNETGQCNNPGLDVQCQPSQICDCSRDVGSVIDGVCQSYECRYPAIKKPLDEAIACLTSTEIFKKLNARITSTSGGTHTSGSCHYLGLAADVAWGGGRGTDDMANTPSADKSAFEEEARRCDFTVVFSEIQCPSYCDGNCGPGQCAWSAPHYHLAVCGCASGGCNQQCVQCASGN